jgi:hypothetical protein
MTLTPQLKEAIFSELDQAAEAHDELHDLYTRKSEHDSTR